MCVTYLRLVFNALRSNIRDSNTRNNNRFDTRPETIVFEQLTALQRDIGHALCTHVRPRYAQNASARNVQRESSSRVHRSFRRDAIPGAECAHACSLSHLRFVFYCLSPRRNDHTAAILFTRQRNTYNNNNNTHLPATKLLSTYRKCRRCRMVIAVNGV